MEAINISGNLAQPRGNGVAAKATGTSNTVPGNGFAEVLASSVAAATHAPTTAARPAGSAKMAHVPLETQTPPTAKALVDQQASDAVSAALAGSMAVALALATVTQPIGTKAAHVDGDQKGPCVGTNSDSAGDQASPVAAGTAAAAVEATAGKQAATTETTTVTATTESSAVVSTVAAALTSSLATQMNQPVAASVAQPIDNSAPVVALPATKSASGASTGKGQAPVGPALQALVRQVKNLQSETAASKFGEPQHVVVATTLRPGATVRSGSDMGGSSRSTLVTVQSLMPRQDLEQLRNNLAVKAAPLASAAVGDKAAVVPSAEPQGKNSGGQQTPRRGSDEAPNSNSSGTVDGSFADLAVKAAKQNSPAAPTGDTVHGSDAAPATPPQISVPAMSGLRVQGNGDGATMQAPSASTTPNAGPNWRLPDDGTTKGVSTAQLADAASHTEMRIAMQTDKLGNIELRAHLTGETVGAAITVEKRDAHSILAVELPALQQALSEKSLRVEQVALFQGTLDLNHSQSGKDAEQQQANGAQHQAKAWTMQSSNSMNTEFMHVSAFDSAGRLNVRA